MSSAKWQTCPEWDLKYLKQEDDGETKNGPLPGAAHAFRPWSGESLSFPR
ncbi:hypothetical protein T4A_10458 [Trichinella pseudospiralis]|uniref:Uncharacterized protein n=1 Tax=Trichinella pseudospiralis TaxID=6337 RepID=A0A0V1DMW4_TRIPS|nr:hypothetical protein T4A_10458 [Trichinella pseudospiralis]